MPIHPRIDKESGLEYGEWKEEWKDIVGYENTYAVNHEASVKNKKTGQILKLSTNNTVGLYDEKGKCRSKFVYHIVLESFFPHIPRNNRTCDHFDENHLNHYINNLWWLTPREQNVKSNKLKPRKGGVMRSKPVEQWSNENPSIKIKSFISVMEAERQTGIHNGSIAKCANGKRLTASGFRWKFQQKESQKDIEGEEWKSNEVLVAALKLRNPKMKPKSIVKVRVSNFGRILTAQGLKTIGKKEGQNKCYRCYANWRVHQLIWMVFGDGRSVPKKFEDLVIMHNDEKEKDEEGCVSNAISNLKLGTKSENQLSVNRTKAKKRMFSDISTTDGRF